MDLAVGVRGDANKVYEGAFSFVITDEVMIMGVSALGDRANALSPMLKTGEGRF